MVVNRRIGGHAPYPTRHKNKEHTGKVKTLAECPAMSLRAAAQTERGIKPLVVQF